MAVRTIRVIGDEILYKECKPVKEMTQRVEELIEDMFETMYENNGVGLAAPQVGILKQIVVIDVDDGNQYVLINPEIIEEEGSQTGQEGCLSVPGKAGIVTRPQKVKVKALIFRFNDLFNERIRNFLEADVIRPTLDFFCFHRNRRLSYRFPIERISPVDSGTCRNCSDDHRKEKKDGQSLQYLPHKKRLLSFDTAIVSKKERRCHRRRLRIAYSFVR